PSQTRRDYWNAILFNRSRMSFPAKFGPNPPPVTPPANSWDPNDPEYLIRDLPTAAWQALDQFYNLAPPLCSGNPPSYWWSTFNNENVDPQSPANDPTNPLNLAPPTPWNVRFYPQFGPPIVLSAGPDRRFGFEDPIVTANGSGIDDIDS